MLLFLDFEASSLLPGSFPIEIAWVDSEGRGESHLIRPTDAWLGDGRNWSGRSETVHGISLESLMRDGEPAADVARRAADVLSPRGTMACSDAPGHDGYWLEKLLVEAEGHRRVHLAEARQVYGFACRPLLDGLVFADGDGRRAGEERVAALSREIVARAEEVEARRTGTRHRALPDAERLRRTWMAVRAEVSRHVAGEAGQ